MAVAGGNTWAYYQELEGDAFKPARPGDAQTRPWSLLPTVDDAVRRILAGERVLVAGSDVFTVRQLVLREVERRRQGEGKEDQRAD